MKYKLTTAIAIVMLFSSATVRADEGHLAYFVLGNIVGHITNFGHHHHRQTHHKQVHVHQRHRHGYSNNGKRYHKPVRRHEYRDHGNHRRHQQVNRKHH